MKRQTFGALVSSTVLVPVLVLTGCGSSSGSTAAAGSAGTVSLDEHANNTTVRVGVGATVRIALHSTYWSPVTSSAPELVEPVGTPTAMATATSPACRPGSGCGTVTTTFLTRGAGSARLTATRTTCGEALLCAPDQRTFTVTVQVANGG